MTDLEFNKKLLMLTKAHSRYQNLLSLCEAEYERRYGVHPSDIDNDMWIDTFHVVGGRMTAKEVDESHVNYCNGESYYQTVQ